MLARPRVPSSISPEPRPARPTDLASGAPFELVVSQTVPAWSAFRGRPWPTAMIVGALLVPLTFLPLKAVGGVLDVPYQHFYIVSAISVLAAGIACALALATVQIGLYRVLFLCLGFMSMGAIFAVHGLTTPGILVPNLFSEYPGSAWGPCSSESWTMRPRCC